MGLLPLAVGARLLISIVFKRIITSVTKDEL
jgi:hypothetical protein